MNNIFISRLHIAKSGTVILIILSGIKFLQKLKLSNTFKKYLRTKNITSVSNTSYILYLFHAYYQKAFS